MYKQKSVLTFFLFLLVSFSGLVAQIVVTPSTGCMPSGVTNALFTYNGSGTPTNIVWDYGDGSPTSNLLTTQHSYPNVGTYIVKFTATVGGQPVSYQTTVNVYNPPTGNFTMSQPSSHCAPMTVNFTGSGSSSNLAYTWAYGDLAGGSGSTVSHVYTSKGTYTPNVTIQNTLTGCFVTVTGNPIHVSNPPIIFHTANPGYSTCAPTFITALDASGSISGSPVAGPLNYSWSYPGGSSSQPNTGNISFSPSGVYIVTLTVTDNNSCSSTSQILISLVTPTVSITVPGTVCVQGQNLLYPAPDENFTVTINTNCPSSSWDMGDGTFYPNFPIPPPQGPTPNLQPNTPYTATIHAYPSNLPGLKTVTATVNLGSCVAQATANIFVEKIIQQYSSLKPTYTCSPEFAFTFTNQSTVNNANVLSHTWTVNHWNKLPNSNYSSTQTNPTFTLHQGHQGSRSPYMNYSHPPYFINASLYTESPAGCYAYTKNQPMDTILRPTAMFRTTTVEGCAPLSMTLMNTSVTDMKSGFAPNFDPTHYPVDSYTWNFGGSPSNTVAGSGPGIPDEVFVYTTPGVYKATLSIITKHTGTPAKPGTCEHTSYEHTITVVDPVTIAHTVPAGPVCAGQAIQLNLSANAPVQHWHVESNGGQFSGCVDDPVPSWTLSALPSPQIFTISAYRHGCLSQVVTSPLMIRGPLGQMKYQTNCAGNQKSIDIYYHLEDVATATLNFGDTSPDVILAGTQNGIVDAISTHVYTPGNYVVTLESENPAGCGIHTATMAIVVEDLIADFVFLNPVKCKDDAIQVSAATSKGVYITVPLPGPPGPPGPPTLGTGYSWYVENMPPAQTHTTLAALTNADNGVGMHPVTLVVKDKNGCSAKITKSYRVSAPAPNFTFNTNPICFSGLPVKAINLTPQMPDAVTHYTWYLGDNILTGLPPTPLATNQTSIAGNVGNHSPTFGYPTLNNNQTLTFTIKLIAENSFGCVEEKDQNLIVNDPKIQATPDQYIGCAPSNRNFYFATAPSHTSYTVDYGDGVVSVINNTPFPSVFNVPHNYLNAGVYSPTITLVDFAGCTATVPLGQIQIQTVPVASFTFENVINKETGKLEYCAPFSPSLTSTTPSLHPLSYTWDLGVNPPQTSLSYSATDNYPDAEGNYTISMRVETVPAGCASYVEKKIKVFKPKIDFNFEPDSTKRQYCLGEPINVIIKDWSGLQAGYQWDFGDGYVTQRQFAVAGLPSTQKATYTNTFYPSQTNGTLTIEVVGYAGQEPSVCKDVKRKNVNIIRVIPDFMRNNELLQSDYQHCLGKPDFFKNQSTSNVTPSNLTYTWSLGDGTAMTSSDVPHTYTAAGIYTVMLNAMDAINSCTAATSKTMVVFPLPTASFTLVPFSCPGEPFLANGSGTPGVSGVLTGTMNPGSVPVNFDNSNTFTVSTSATVSTTYSVKVTDDNGCEGASSTSSIYIPKAAPRIDWDTTVIIGQSVTLNSYVGPGFTYTWFPLVDFLDCDTCTLFNPVSTSTIPITYTVEVQDEHKCSVVKNTYHINIEILASLDVPSAFTPNGDGINDMILPDGWGLKKLNYFRVFNRWGQLVFETNQLEVGWDGIFRGVPQNMETYVYQASADTYSEKDPTITKTGTFKLLR